MKIVIIGNGPAGTTAAKKIRKLNEDIDITIISFEEYPYYTRPKLHKLIENKVEIENIIVYKEEWYKNNRINLLLETNVISIDTKNKKVVTNKDELFYDKLIIASGCNPFLPKITGIKNNDIYTLRSIKDALQIREAAKINNEIICIGGGLLGIELASSFISKTRNVKIIEIAGYLLIKQLKENQGIQLMKILEEKGLQFYLHEKVKEIFRDNKKLTARTESGKEIKGDLILVSSGVSPRISIAQEAGIKVDRGIIVNQYLQTSHPDIYAAGDCIQFNEKIYGFIKSSIEQGNIAGENIINNNSTIYNGTKIDPVLKVTGIDLKKL